MSSPEDRRGKGLLQDLHRYSPGKPNWKGFLMILIFHAGFLAVFLFRLGRFLRSKNRFFLARLAHRISLALTGADLNDRAEIGPGLMLPHPVGVVIGNQVKIGKDVTLYQGVTLGAKAGAGKELTRGNDYPEIGDKVILYPNVLIYGKAVIGKEAIVLAHSVVNRPVPPGSVFGGIPAREVRRQGGIRDVGRKTKVL